MFTQLKQLWGPHSIDRFASSYNAKLSRFNSRFLQLGTEAVDAFTQGWSSENNWLVPPISLIGRLLSHMHESKAFGTLIVPMWKSSYFWPLLCSDDVHFSSFLADWFNFFFLHLFMYLFVNMSNSEKYMRAAKAGVLNGIRSANIM